MTYPKPLMSITELVKMGFPRDMLYKAAHAQGCERYIIRTPGGGKILFDVEKWEKMRRKWR
jgi:hypothetical protein